MSYFSRNVNVEIRGAARDFIKWHAKERQTTPYDIVRRALSLLAAVDEEPEYDLALVNRKTGAIRRLIMPQ